MPRQVISFTVKPVRREMNRIREAGDKNVNGFSNYLLINNRTRTEKIVSGNCESFQVAWYFSLEIKYSTKLENPCFLSRLTTHFLVSVIVVLLSISSRNLQAILATSRCPNFHIQTRHRIEWMRDNGKIFQAKTKSKQFSFEVILNLFFLYVSGKSLLNCDFTERLIRFGHELLHSTFLVLEQK